MKKNDYKKPNMCVVKIQQRQNLLQASPGSTTPGPGGGDAREYSGDEGSSSSGGSVWDKEW